MEKAQSITSDFLDEIVSEFESKKTIKVDTPKGKVDVQIYKYFSEDKINKLITDLTDLMTPLLGSDDINVDDLASPIGFMPVLILREFTDLPIPEENDLTLISAVSEKLVKTGIARQTFDQMNQHELKKLGKIVSEGFKNMPKFQRAYQELFVKYNLQQSKEEVDSNSSNQTQKSK